MSIKVMDGNGKFTLRLGEDDGHEAAFLPKMRLMGNLKRLKARLTLKI